MNITSFNITDDIIRYVIKKDNGFEVSVLNLGCIIEKIMYGGQNMVLSYSDYSCYYNNPAYIGAIIGRTSGRIKNATFNIGNNKYFLDKNDKDNNNHGGYNGLHNKIFKGSIIENGVKLEYYDVDESKYPAKVLFTVIYTVLEDKDSLKMEYYGKSDKLTYINLTNHTYFNLSGLKENATKHFIKINADNYMYLANDMVSEKLEKVDNTVFDFREGKYLDADLAKKNEQFDISYYFDHPFSLNKKNKEYDVLLRSDISNVSMKIKTNQRAVVMYLGNYLHEVKAVDGVLENERHLGVALETQDYPNGINLGEDFYNLTDENKPYYSCTELIFEKDNKN